MFVPSREAQKYYGVSPETLRLWAINGDIEHTTTKGGHRRYKILHQNDTKVQKTGVFMQ